MPSAWSVLTKCQWAPGRCWSSSAAPSPPSCRWNVLHLALSGCFPWGTSRSSLRSGTPRYTPRTSPLDKLADGRYLLPLLLKTVERKRRIKVGKSLVSFMELKAVSTRNKPRRSPKRSPQISKRYPQNSADHHMAPLDHRRSPQFITDLRSSSQITTGSPQIAGLRIRIGNVLRHHLAAFVGRRRAQLENARVVDETLRRGAGITAALKFGRSVCTTSLNSGDSAVNSCFGINSEILL